MPRRTKCRLALYESCSFSPELVPGVGSLASPARRHFKNRNSGAIGVFPATEPLPALLDLKRVGEQVDRSAAQSGLVSPAKPDECRNGPRPDSACPKSSQLGERPRNRPATRHVSFPRAQTRGRRAKPARLLRMWVTGWTPHHSRRRRIALSLWVSPLSVRLPPHWSRPAGKSLSQLLAPK